MHVNSARSWMLRTELGVNGYYDWRYNCGDLILRGKLSWINKNPHNEHMVAAIVGTPGDFSVEVFTRNQNLVSPALELTYKGKGGFFSALTYNGEFGSGYLTNEAMGRIGWYF